MDLSDVINNDESSLGEATAEQELGKFLVEEFAEMPVRRLVQIGQALWLMPSYRKRRK
jgi:hypothetical protein